MISKSQIKLIKSLEYKKFRDREGLFVAEGPKIVSDLLGSFDCAGLYGVDADAVRQTDGDSDYMRLFYKKKNCPGCNFNEISAEELHKISFLKTPQDVLGVFRKPVYDESMVLNPENLSLALDDVQDPGNMGTIIRLADWFGVDTVFCSVGCADCWSPKVVQASMGSIARVNVVYIDLAALMDDMSGKMPVFGTFLDGDSVYEKKLPKNGLVIMGNEGNGISDALRRRVTDRLQIPPFRSGAESLNVAVATAIILSEFRRK